jgi:hypothetical protein
MLRTNLKIRNLDVCSKETDNRFSRRLNISALTILLFFTCSIFSFAQTGTGQPRIMPAPTPVPTTPLPHPSTAPRTRPTPKPPARVWTRPAKRVHNESDIPAEKSIAVDSRVNVSLCISEGNVKINGWERNEIRAFVDGGSEVGFKILQKKNQNPVWVMVLGFDPKKTTEAGIDECLSGDDIEIDVPRGATVNLKGRETEVNIFSVNRVKVENIAGDIRLSGIGQGIEAKTYEGSVTVENSRGAINLVSTNGNILALDAEAGEIGDVFSAKTSSGVITLQQIAHRQIEAGSNSGSIRFTGEFATGGRYVFGTTNGSISLMVPGDSSCKIRASYGGAFHSDIPLNDVVNNAASQVKTLTGNLGSGEASVNLTTFSGTIRIRKK